MIDDKNMPDDIEGGIIPEIDPEKLFDEKEYTTIILGDDAKQKKDTENAHLASVLISNKTSREEKDDALQVLKNNNATLFLLRAIDKTKNPEHKSKLIAACWESGLDFSNHFKPFMELVGHENFQVSFEAFTVIQELDGKLSKPDLIEALDILNKLTSSNQIYIDDAKEFIQQQLNAL